MAFQFRNLHVPYVTNGFFIHEHAPYVALSEFLQASSGPAMLPSDNLSPQTRLEDQLIEHVPCLSEDLAFVLDHPAEEIEALDGTLLRINRTTKASFQRLQLVKLNPHRLRPTIFNPNNGSIVGRWPR